MIDKGHLVETDHGRNWQVMLDKQLLKIDSIRRSIEGVLFIDEAFIRFRKM